MGRRGRWWRHLKAPARGEACSQASKFLSPSVDCCEAQKNKMAGLFVGNDKDYVHCALAQ
ncbi:hypothetical protein CHELA1G2_11899 [Hyphomicrobiales bacterium]|nr:hypothetical protein CHELA1G2_11899 [Hyphomicrobiales bacterium]